MGAGTGLTGLAVFTGMASTDDVFDALIALIPDPDAPTAGSGSISGGGFLDEMSPGACAQLRVELTAAKAYCDDAFVPAGEDPA